MNSLRGRSRRTGFRQALDVLVNNAGVSLIATVEEASDQQIRDLFEANYFETARTVYADRIATWEAWEDVSKEAQGDTRKGTPAS